MFRLITTVATVVLLSSVAAGAQESASLRADIAPGDELVYESVESSKATAQGAAQESEARARLRFEALERNAEDRLIVRLTYPSMAIETQLGPTTLAYDTENPEQAAATPQMRAAVDALVDSALTLVVGEDGAITEIRGLDELHDASSGAFQDATNESALTREYGLVFASTPTLAEASPGDSWKRTVRTSIVAGLEIVVDLTSTLDAINGGEAKVSVTGVARIETDSPQGLTEPQLEAATVRGSETRDAASGRLHSRRLTMNFTLSAKMGGPARQTIEIESDRALTLISSD